MKIYHVETQEDYDALMVELEEKGYNVMPIKGNRFFAMQKTCVIVFDGLPARVVSLDFASKQFPHVAIGKYKAKQNDVESSIKQVTQNNAELFHKIITDLEQTYLAKNKDYGNSFEESLNEFGEVAGIVRIGDKFNRAKNLSKNKANVKDESKIDTYLDMANYCIMQGIWLMKQEG